MREPRVTVVVVAVTVLALGAMGLVAATRDGGSGGATALGAAPTETTVAPADTQVGVTPTTSAAAPGSTVAAAAVEGSGGDLVEATAGTCVIRAMKLAMGDSGSDVSCLQQGLINAGYTNVAVSGTFDGTTFNAVEQLQSDRDLFVDGIVGRETALSIGVWPDEESFVVRTPAPAGGCRRTHSASRCRRCRPSVPMPHRCPRTGSGRRVVYDRRSQRVWAVDESGNVVRSYLVSGSKYGNEAPGVHKVYSRSEMSTAWNGRAFLPLMIRYQKTSIGAIGFHAIPIHAQRRHRRT